MEMLVLNLAMNEIYVASLNHTQPKQDRAIMNKWNLLEVQSGPQEQGRRSTAVEPE